MANLDAMKNDYDGSKNLSRIKKTINEQTNAGAHQDWNAIRLQSSREYLSEKTL